MKLKSLFSIFAKSNAGSVGIPENEAIRKQDFDASDAKSFIASGIAKAKSGNYTEAIQDFDKAIQLDPTDPSAYMERSKAKRELNDERGASQDLSECKVRYERLDDGLKAHETASAAYDSGDYVSAVKNYNKAISLVPSLLSIYCNRGNAKQCLEDYRGAVEDFTKSIEVNASNKSDAYHQRGKIKYHKLNDTNGALEDFNEAIALCPDDSDLLFSRATITSEYNALQDLNRAIELSPTNPKLFFYRALKRHGMEDVEGAIQDLTQFIELEPTDTDISISEAYSLRGSMKEIQCDYMGAIHDHTQAIGRDASRASGYRDRGVTKHRLGDYEGAILDLNQAIALDPSDADAYQWRGLARVEVGLQSEGEKDFADARSLGYSENASEQ